ncbi:MAG: polysaccharide biosynthesis protein, partial [Pseudomonadota bacterium]|nr:polysaccharide biosynthesis protein [Pseudomonadota bacterium]
KIVILNPKKLVLIDVSENAIYNLKYFFRDHSYLNKITFSCSNIRNKNEMEKLFDRYKPDIIFHAGALKHVTICEENISEAIRTNVIATSMLANLAEKFSSKCFVLISTDKAVEPTSVMGLTKKMAEIVIKSKDKLGEKNTRFIVVRFGNVLGSTGSVIPLFKKQLSNGGPLTVTDKKVTRFFMTIDEAVNLVMHASSESVFKPSIPAGCINVLNMGESIKIDDLAKQVIRLSGLEPIKDIQIKYTGLKQGEKLYEKLYANDEEKIKEGMQGYFLVNSNKTNKIDASTILEELESLCVQDNNNIRNDLFKILEKK